MKKRRLLDLFCCAGGASAGYAQAGFEVVGVDIKPQPHYPFEFHQGDALTFPLDGFDAVAASPHCQGYSITRHLHKDRAHPRQVEEVRERLRAWGGVYVIENVEGAPLLPGSMLLCGTMFPGLRVFRHRVFESNVYLLSPGDCQHGRRRAGSHRPGAPSVDGFCSVYGKGSHGVSKARAAEAMGIEWMTVAELAQAIPPAYTRYLGQQLLAALDRREVA
jgi:DNA (cytosine-5)-methyltransferase 1